MISGVPIYYDTNGRDDTLTETESVERISPLRWTKLASRGVGLVARGAWRTRYHRVGSWVGTWMAPC
jgi:hypothetical protein